MLLWLVDNGQGAEALRRLPAAEAADPEPARLLLRLGQALDENREAMAAAQLLERSLALEPSRAETRLALGRALFDAGRPAEAILHLEKALEAGFRIDTAGFTLVQALAAAGRPVAPNPDMGQVAERLRLSRASARLELDRETVPLRAVCVAHDVAGRHAKFSHERQG